MSSGGARAHVSVDRTVAAARGQARSGIDDAGLFATLEAGLFCVDGNNLLWRAAHGRPAPFSADDGRDLTPLFRFFSMLRRAVGTYGLFAECVVCFDGAQAWRRRLSIDATYKANRSYDDADLSFLGWLPEIRAALDASGVTYVELVDEEADDVIATLAALAGRTGGREVRVLSTDRDYYQLVSPTTAVVDPRSRPPLVDAAVVHERYGVHPHQWCDFRALAGDPSDGIPGLAGVGPKRAAALLANDRTLDDLEERLDARQRADVRRWRELIELRTDVAVGVTLSGEPTPKLPSATAVCRSLGLVG